MKSGGPIHPTSRRPLAERQIKRGADDKAAEQRRLVDAADFIAVHESRASKKLQELIYNHLFIRIEALLSDDPECRAYVDMLRAMKERRNIAEIAARKLMETGCLKP